MISLSLAMNGCSFDYFAPTIYKCICLDSPEAISIPVQELPHDKRQLVEKVQYTSRHTNSITNP